MSQHLLQFTVRTTCIAMLVFSYSVVAVSNDEKAVAKWQPRLSLELRPGTERSLGRLDLFWPFMQRPDRLFFTDIRAIDAAGSSFEANLGLGYRQMMTHSKYFGGQWIWGAYGFFDRRRSSNQKYYSQATVGGELYGENWAFRANGYLPEGDSHIIATAPTSDGIPAGVISLDGTNVVVGTGASGLLVAKERALPGFDVEAGYRFGVNDNQELWLYGGYFRFKRDHIPEIEGPRVRAEYRFRDVMGIDGSELTFGAEYQHDDIRGGQTFGIARISVPFGGGAKKRKSSMKLTGLERRMTEWVERDVDVVAFADDITKPPNTPGGPTQIGGTGGSAGSIPATDAASGEALNVFHIADTAQGAGDCSSPANACTAATALGLASIGDTIVPVDVAGVVLANIPLSADRQQVVGGGNTGTAAIALSDAASSVLNLSGLGGQPTVRGTVTLSQTNTIRGFDINNNAGVGLQVNGDVGVTGNAISDMTISGSTAGVRFSAASAGTVTFANDVTINGQAGGPAFDVLGGTANATASGNITQAAANDAVSIAGGHTGTLTFDTGAINATNGLGLQFDNADGTYNFNGTTTLNGTGGGTDTGIDISNDSEGTFTFGANTSITHNNAAAAFDVNTATNPGITYRGAINNSSGRAISIQNTTAGANTITFDSAAADAIQDSGSGIFLNTVAQNVNFTADAELTGTEGVQTNFGSGTFTFTDTDIAPTGVGGPAFEIAGGTKNVNFQINSSITQARNQDAVEITNHSVGTADFDGNINATNGLGLQFSNADGIYRFDGTTTLNGGDAGIDILGGSGGTFTFSANTSITNPTGTTFNEDTSTANVSYNGTITQNNAASAVEIDAKTDGTTTFAGQVTANTGTATGIDLSGNLGGTINVTGGLDIDTTSGIGFNATGGGTINVTGAGNTITTVETAGGANDAGQAIVMNGVTIGANDITFATISATNVAAGTDALSFTTVSNAGTFDGGNVTVTEGDDGIFISGSSATFSFASATIDNTGDAGIALTGANGPVTFTTVDIDGTWDAGIDIAGNTNAVNINGGTIGATTTTTGNAVDIAGGAGNVTVAAAVTNSAARSVEVTGRTAGTVTFSGTVTDTGTGINLASNTGGSITFTALTDLDTGANDAITLNGNNGAAIDFNNVDIDTASGNGIDATGANSNVDVSGTVAVAIADNRAFEFTNTSGDYDYSVVTSTQTGGVGGVGQVFGAVHSGTYNLGIHTVTSPGANALTVNGTTLILTYESLTINGVNPTDDAIQFSDVGGSLTINGGTIRSDVRGIEVINTGAVDFDLTTASTQFDVTNDGIFAETSNAGSTLDVNVSGITAASNFGVNAIEIEWDDGGGTATITNNTIDSGFSGTGLIEMDSLGTNTTVTATITNTNVSGNAGTGEGIDIRSAGNNGTVNVTITGGTIGPVADGNFGEGAIDLSSSGMGSRLLATVTGVTIDGNNATDFGILVETNATGEIDATLTNNTIRNIDGVAFNPAGVLVDIAGGTGNACLNATGNSNGAGGGVDEGFLLDDGTHPSAAVLDISQASLAALGLINLGSTVTEVAVGSVTFNAPCQTPP